MIQKQTCSIILVLFFFSSQLLSYTIIRTSDMCKVEQNNPINFNNLESLFPVQTKEANNRPAQVKLLTSTNFQPGNTPYKNKIASHILNCSMGILLFTTTILAAINFPEYVIIHIPLFIFSLIKIVKNCSYITKITISKQCLTQVA